MTQWLFLRYTRRNDIGVDERDKICCDCIISHARYDEAIRFPPPVLSLSWSCGLTASVPRNALRLSWTRTNLGKWTSITQACCKLTRFHRYFPCRRSHCQTKRGDHLVDADYTWWTELVWSGRKEALLKSQNLTGRILMSNLEDNALQNFPEWISLRSLQTTSLSDKDSYSSGAKLQSTKGYKAYECFLQDFMEVKCA